MDELKQNHIKVEEKESEIKDIKIIKKFNKWQYSLNYILVGDTATGKSRIIESFCEEPIGSYYTVGVDIHYNYIKINQIIYRLRIFDNP